MIVFEGELNELNLNRLKKQLRKKDIITCTFFYILITAIMIGIIVTIKSRLVTILLSATFILSTIIVAVIIVISNRNNNNVQRCYAKRIEIDEGLIWFYYDNCDNARRIINVKKVVDYGDSYGIIFQHQIISAFCQKDLITEGSIEAFETLFVGKIVKYNDKN